MSKDRPTIEVADTELARSLSEFDITMIGVGAMIGAGIFVLTGIAAGTTGPSLMLAFALNGIVTIFTAMVYAELGSAIPEAGGGYLWVRDALGRQQGFLAGWMSWFSHAVAGALYALGFGSFAAKLLEIAGVGLPHVLWMSPDQWVGVLIGIAFLGINLRGASETGLAGNIITLAKLTVIGVFVVFGFVAIFGHPHAAVDRFEPFFPKGFGNVFVAMGITFIAFEGYEIIVQAGEEVRDPQRSVPRAIFTSMMIVIPIYVLVAITAIGAVKAPGNQPTWQFLGAKQELGLAEAAAHFIPFGTIIVLVGGLLSTISALNATTYSSTRVSFAMGRDQVLPKAFGRVHHRFKTPYVALGATGLIILTMVALIPIQDVAAAADVMFLLLFLQVNYAVIRIRGEFGDRLDYGYLMPFYPWVPLIGIVAQAFLAVYLFQYSPAAWLFAGIWIAVGVAIFFGYVRTRVAAEEEPRVTFEHKSGVRSGRSILAAIGNPATAASILSVATAVARARDAEVVALPVVRIPPQLPMHEGRRRTHEAEPAIWAIEEYAAEVDDVPIHTVVGVGRAISATIVDIAEREEAELLVIGWHGELRESRVRGSVAQEVLRVAEQDVYVVKDPGEQAPRHPDEILVGVSPGLRARAVVRAAAGIAAGHEVPLRLLTVVRTEGTNRARIEENLDDAREAALERGVGEVTTEIIASDTALDAFVERAGPGSLFVAGASRDWMYRRTLLGAFPDELVNRLPCATVVLRTGAPRALDWWRHLADVIRRRQPGRERATTG